MFGRINKIIIGSLLILILGLCVWSWRQSSTITSLEATNQAQAQVITQLETNQKHLKTALAQEQQAVISQQKIASELKSQMENSREKVKVILQKEPCGVTTMPTDVIHSIKRLHKDGR